MLSKENIKNIYTLSPMQEGMYFHALYDKSSFAYFEQMSYHLHGDLNIDFVKKSLDELFERYDILRTVFVEKKADKILQVVLKEREVDFLYRDISSRDDKDNYVREFKEEDKKRSFDLNKDVLMRVAVIKTAADEYEFIWSHHHILMDGWCVGIMISEFFEIYNAFLEKRPYKLAPVTPYVNYIQWLEKQDRTLSRNFWQEYLAGYEEAVGVPRKKTSKDEYPGFKEERVVSSIDKEETALLNALAAKERVTLNTIVQTVWAFVLSKYNSRPDVVFGAVVSGRPPEIENVDAMVGLFINTVPVRIDFSENMAFDSLLQRVQREYAAGERHHYFPLNEIQSFSPLKQNLLDHIIAFQNFPVAEQVEGVTGKGSENGETGKFRVSRAESFERTNYDLLIAVGSGSRLTAAFEFNGNVYNWESIERIAGRFKTVLTQIAADEKQKIDDIVLLSDEEKRQVLVDFNDTTTRYPEDKPLHRLFEEQVEKSPEQRAVDFATAGTSPADSASDGACTQLTYRELDELANGLAELLVGKGVRPGTVVALMIERGLEMVVALLGILKAGGAYLPIGPAYPEERKAYILKDSAAGFFITTRDLSNDDETWISPAVEILFIDGFASGSQGAFFEKTAPQKGRTQCVHPNSTPYCVRNSPAKTFDEGKDRRRGWRQLCVPPNMRPNPVVGARRTVPGDPAYVIYTSGTTGFPKGVLVEHGGVVNYALWLIDNYGLDGSRVHLQLFSFTFDGFGGVFYSSLLSGGSIVVIPEEKEQDFFFIKDAVREKAVTDTIIVPAMLDALLESDTGSDLDSLERVTLAGEEANENIIEKAGERYPGLMIYNEYGPTENSIGATYYRDYMKSGRTDIIGKPNANTRLYILDKSGNPLPPEIPGELVIGGVGVARGYLNRPGLTYDKFIFIASGGPPFCKKVGPKTFPEGPSGHLGAAHHLNCQPKRKYSSNFFNPTCVEERLADSRHIRENQSPVLLEGARAACYKTGDLACWLPDGNVKFVARIDNQVKIRGFRIELQEIENRLLQHKQVKHAVVTVVEDEAGNRSLCAYMVGITPDEMPDAAELRQYLSDSLPAYMVPAYFVPIETIPFTANGKIDRKALPHPGQSGFADNVEFEAPRNAVEKELQDTWMTILGRENVGIHDDFFMIGGDSIKSIQIVSAMRAAGYKLEVRDIFENPRIADLAPLTGKLKRIPGQKEVTGIIPLTPIQKRFFAQPKTALHHFNQAVLLYSQEGFEEDIVKDVFMKIQEHHDTLRMTYKLANDPVIQTNQGVHYPLALQVFDLKGQPEAKAELTANANEIQASINLETGPMMKLGLFHMDDGDRLLIAIHHLVVDGVSWRILFEDFENLYRQKKGGEPFSLPLKSDSFKEWSLKLSEYANSESFLAEKNYWAEIESREVPGIMKDLDVENSLVKDTDMMSFALNEDETNLLLTKVNHAFGTEINDILLTAFALGVSKSFSVNPVLIALEGHGREEIMADIDIGRTIGWFTTVYPVVIDIVSPDNLGRLVKEVKENLRRIPNKGIGYGILKYVTDEKHIRDVDFRLKPQLSFNYLGQFDRDVAEKSFKIAKESAGSNVSGERCREYDVDVSGMTAGGKLSMSIVFNKGQFEVETIAGLLNNFKTALSRIIEFCAARQKRELTPHDLTYKDLAIEDLEWLMDRFPNLEDVYTLTPMQEGMLFHSLLENETSDTDSTPYFEQTSYRFRGTLAVAAVEKSLNDLFKRHDVLRTVFVHENLKRPMQAVLSDRKADFYYEDISKTGSREDKEKYVGEFKETDKRRNFDLSKEALLRVAILQVDREEYEFIWSFHHILMDGWCVGIVNSEFFEIYNSYIDNREARLSPIKPYRNYIRWLEKQDKGVSRDYWAGYLQSYDDAAFIPRIKVPERETKGFKSDYIMHVLKKKDAIGLKNLAGGNRVTLNTVFQALWGIILSRYSGKNDVVFGTVVSGRPAEIEGVESMVGLFINTIPVRVKYDVDTRFSDLLQTIRDEAIASEVHHYYPLADIQSATPLKQNLLDHLFVYENFPIAGQIEKVGESSGSPGSEEKIKVVKVEVFEQTNYDLYLTVTPGEEFVLRFDFNANVYPPNYMAGILTHFEQVMSQILENKFIVIDELALLSEEERRRILYDFNDTKTNYPKHKVIHQLFEEQAERLPDNIAVVQHSGNYSFSYKKLKENVNLLAQNLRNNGVGVDTLVAILGERNIETLTGILGILKAGGAFLPVDPDYPPKRMQDMLIDANPDILLTQSWLRERIEFTGECIELDDLSLYKVPEKHIDNINGPEDLAYVMYTSGSTGKSKGVMVRHRSVVRLVVAADFVELSEETRILQTGAPVFDATTFEIWGALLNGGILYLTGNDIILDADQLGNTLSTYRINTIWLTAPLFNQLAGINDEIFTGLKYLLVGGDILSPKHIEMVRRKNEKLNIINGYGPTENTTFSTTFLIDREFKENIPIGSPVGNSTAYVVDTQDRPQPVGVFGELLVGGDGVARGYLNSPGLTAEKFMECSFIEGERLYRTGDIARWLPDGNIDFSGRIDNQVKIRGFRIELGEIENQLQKHDKIKEAVIVVRKNENGEKYLAAYFVSSAEIPAVELRDFLTKEFPEYMIPAHFVSLPEFPLTENGKIDRKALPAPEKAGSEQECRYKAPTNELEAALADTWEQVLGREKIGIHENFFMVGGDSIKSIQINARMRKLGYKVEMKDIFGFPTIAELAPRMKKVEQIVDQSPVTGVVPLTPIQCEFFLEHPTTAAHFNQSVMLVLKERLPVETLRAVFSKLQEQHDTLRMTFEENDGNIVQKNNDLDFPVSISEYDLTHQQNAAAEIEARANEIQASIDLGTGPLMKVGLFHLNDSDRLLIVIHHLVVDGVSWRILFEDIEALLRQSKNEESFKLPLKTHSFQSWAERLTGYANSEPFLEEKSYWARFEGVEFPLVPTDFAGGDNRIKDMKMKSFNISAEDTELLLSKVNEAFNTEINDILLTALGLAVRQTYGHEKVLIALEGHGREDILADVDISRTVGWFTSVYPLLLDVSMAEDLSRQIKEVKESLHKIPSKGVGYGILKYLTAPENKQGFTFDLKPQISFNYLGQFDSDMNRDSLKMAAESQGRGIDQEMGIDYDLVVTGILARKTLNLSVQYSNKQFKAETISLLTDNLHEQLKKIIAYCVSREEKEITPSDLTYDGLSIDTMESLSAMFDD